MKKLIFAVSVVAVFLLAVSFAEGTTIRYMDILSPEGGEIVGIGEDITVAWSINGPVTSNDSTLVISLTDGPTPATAIASMEAKQGKGEYELTVPENILVGDVGTKLEPGKYRIQLSLYRGTPCFGNCPENNATLVASVKSGFITITEESDDDNAINLTVLDPNGGETAYIGDNLSIEWRLDADEISDDYIIIVTLADGPSSGAYVATIEATEGESVFHWIIPRHVILGDLFMPLTLGDYKIHIALYDGKPCLSGLNPNCQEINEKVTLLAEDKSDRTFEIKARNVSTPNTTSETGKVVVTVVDKNIRCGRTVTGPVDIGDAQHYWAPYCNYICRNRYEEQCILDGSFDTYYEEWCEDASGNRIDASATRKNSGAACLVNPSGYVPNPVSYPEFYRDSSAIHDAAILHRTIRNCDDKSRTNIPTQIVSLKGKCGTLYGSDVSILDSAGNLVASKKTITDASFKLPEGYYTAYARMTDYGTEKTRFFIAAGDELEVIVQMEKEDESIPIKPPVIDVPDKDETDETSVTRPIIPVTKKPVCAKIGTISEGWYVDGKLIKLDTCACKAVCQIEDRVEGYYSSCTGNLIQRADCSERDITVPVPEKSKPTSISNIDEIFSEAKKSGIIENILSRGLVEAVNNVEIKEEGEKLIYEVKGTNTENFLFIFPIKVDKILKIDPETSEIVG